MKKVLIILLLALCTTGALGQAVNTASVNTSPTAGAACSPARLVTARDSGMTWACENGVWVPKDAIGPEYVIVKTAAGYYAKPSSSSLSAFSHATSASVVVKQAYDAIKAGGGTIRFMAGTYNWTQCVQVNPGHEKWVKFVGEGQSTVLDLDPTTSGYGAVTFFCTHNGGDTSDSNFRYIWFEKLKADSHGKRDATRTNRYYTFFGEDPDGGVVANSAYNRGFDNIIVKDVWNWNVSTMGASEYNAGTDPNQRYKGLGLGFHVKQTDADQALGHKLYVRDILVDNYNQLGGNQAVFFGCYNYNDGSHQCNAWVQNIRLVNSWHDMNMPADSARNPTYDHPYTSTCWAFGGRGAQAVQGTYIDNNTCVDSGDNCVEMDQPEDVSITNNKCYNPFLTGTTIVNFTTPVETLDKQHVRVDGWDQQCNYPSDYPLAAYPASAPTALACAVNISGCTTCQKFNAVSFSNVSVRAKGPPNWAPAVWLGQGGELGAISWDNVTYNAELSYDNTTNYQVFYAFDTHLTGWDEDGDGTYGDRDVNISLRNIVTKYKVTKLPGAAGVYKRVWPIWLGGHGANVLIDNVDADVTVDGTWDAAGNDNITGVTWTTRTLYPRAGYTYIAPSTINNLIINNVRVRARHLTNASATGPYTYNFYPGDTASYIAARRSSITNLDLQVTGSLVATKIYKYWDAPNAVSNLHCLDNDTQSYSCNQGRASAQVINMAVASTGGVGTSAKPWTGWDATLTGGAVDTMFYFPCGYYQAAAALSWNVARHKLIGDGACTVLTQGNSTANLLAPIGADLLISGMKLDGGTTGGRSGGIGVYLQGARQTLRDVWITDWPSYGIQTSSAADYAVIENVRADAPATSAASLFNIQSGTDYLRVSNSSFSHPGTGYAIAHGGGTLGVFSGNTISTVNNTSSYGIGINSTAVTNTTFTGNTFEGRFALRYTGAQNVVTGNTFKGTGASYGVRITGGDDGLIVGNHFFGDGTAGASGVSTGLTAAASNIAIVGNTFKTLPGGCAGFTSTASYAGSYYLADNTCYQTTSNACWVTNDGGATAATVTFGPNVCSSASNAYSLAATNVTYAFSTTPRLQLGDSGATGFLKFYNEAGATDYSFCAYAARCGSYNCIAYDNDCSTSTTNDRSCIIIDQTSGGQDKNCDGTAE